MIVLLTSCNRFSYNFPNYSYDNLAINKGINANSTYILNATKEYTDKGLRSKNMPEVVGYFKKRLNQNLIIKKDLKDNRGKYVLPFDIPYKVSKQDLTFLKEATNLDFLILSKIEYLELLNKESLSQKNKVRLFSALSGAIATIKIIDLQNNEVVLEMSCTASVGDSQTAFPEVDEFGIEELESIPIYKSAVTLGKKAMKRLLKKIN
ncbi:hypothetical protein [uncultured Polaribacter sp.]|uniref:hypothetical protein n=1 Tax=uncultured Polaribacter sp. TaxID=174711 RepID=UPI002631D93A|nr:hypothetical protein [uncultured Polaribacter sp.]